MSVSRRAFLRASAAALTVPAAVRSTDATVGKTAGVTIRRASRSSFDPHLEVDPAALVHNVREIERLAGGRPILAVVKNNGYGLGVEIVGPILDREPGIEGLAVVKSDAAIALRKAGVRKPVLLMGKVEDEEAIELAAREIRLTPFGDGAISQLERVAARLGHPAPIHLYLDTGMNRVGTPFRRALPWIEAMAASDAVRVEGTFMGFVEEDDFDPVQLERFEGIVAGAREAGIDLGHLHAASTHGLFFRSAALLDMVRPGLALYGAYPSGARELETADLRPAFRLVARVVRVERIEAGDSVSYGRNYVAETPVWIATIPAGHADGYPRSAVEGCEVWIAGRTYPVIGAVSASHTIVELGPERTVDVGAEAVLVGPDHPAVHPNEVAGRAGVSVYDILMHLSVGLPRELT